MNNEPQKTIKIKLSIFELITLHWVSLALGALILALLGIFYSWLLLLWLLADIAGTVYFVKKGIIKIQPHLKTEKILMILIILLAVVLSIYTTPTIFGGRDEGAFSNAAVMLAQDHQLTHSSDLIQNFAQIYGQGKALNFPGFIYDASGALKSQFLPGYIAWAGMWYSFFGPVGLAFVNLLPLLTFLFAFYLITKRLVSYVSQKFKKNQPNNTELISILSLAILATFLPLIVFYKFTLTELFFASLIWMTIHFLLRYFEEKSYPNFLLVIFPMILASFVRVEAVALIFVLLAIFILKDYNHAKQTRYQFWYAVLALVMLASLIINRHFFVEALKGFGEGFLPNAELGAASYSLEKFSPIPDDWQDFYLLKVLFNYNILALIFLAIIYVTSLFRKKTWIVLFPFFLLAPTLIYLVDANITLDHPWMLRRFVFSIIPLAVLYSLLLLGGIREKFKIFFWTIVVVILLTNILQSLFFVVPSQNKSLLNQTEQLSRNFSSQDLVLVAQSASGSGWSQMAEPLRNVLGFNATYFFRPSDFYDLDQEKYENIYLITSKEEEKLFQDLTKEKVQDYAITNQLINPSRNPLEKPRFIETSTEGTVYRLEKF